MKRAQPIRNRPIKRLFFLSLGVIDHRSFDGKKEGIIKATIIELDCSVKCVSQ